MARDLRFEQISVLEFNREALAGFTVTVEAKRSYPFGLAFALDYGRLEFVESQPGAWSAAVGLELWASDLELMLRAEEDADRKSTRLNSSH